jgi:hypothetical protein
VKKLLLICLSAILFSCAEHKPETAPKPSNLVDPEIMVDVLVDLHLMEASLSLKMLEDHRTARDTGEFYNPYRKHSVSNKDFDDSFRYYASKPEALNEIYEEVLDRINQRQAEVMKSLPKDSISKEKPKINLPGGVPRFKPGAASPGAPQKK